MPNHKLDIVVLLREVSDPRPPARIVPGGGRILDRGLRRLPNPADLAALEAGLRLAEGNGGSVTALAVGPTRLDDLLRLARAMGATRTIRVWDHALEDGDAGSDAVLYGRLQQILDPDLFFSGDRLLDRGDDPALRLAAARAQRPCISAALSATLEGGQALIERKSDRGARQRVATQLPATVLLDATACEPRYPDHPSILAALEAPIEVWGLADLGLPASRLGAAAAALPVSDFALPRQQPLRAVTPDANLPAFERILALLSGGIKPRAGKQRALAAAATAEELLQLFRAEGLLPEHSP